MGVALNEDFLMRESHGHYLVAQAAPILYEQRHLRVESVVVVWTQVAQKSVLES